MITEEEVLKMNSEISEIRSFKQRIQRQQLFFPLDKLSRDVLLENDLVQGDFDVFPFGLAIYDESTRISLNDKNFLLDTTQIFV